MNQEQVEWGSHKLGPLENVEDYHLKNIGTIGGGNHFAEFQEFVLVFDQEAIERHNIDTDMLHLLVHSGSRSLGQ